MRPSSRPLCVHILLPETRNSTTKARPLDVERIASVSVEIMGIKGCAVVVGKWAPK